MTGHADRTVAVVGLGYVGLPVALAFAQAFPGTIGFDIDAARVTALAWCRPAGADGGDGAPDVPVLCNDPSGRRISMVAMVLWR